MNLPNESDESLSTPGADQVGDSDQGAPEMAAVSPPSVPTGDEPEDLMTLDPPGRIAVIGAGVLGLEAALYGRFLGYDVVVFERGEVGQSLRARVSEPLPVFPSGCLSPLAWSAIIAQHGAAGADPDGPLPMTIGQWLDEWLDRLARTDLLRGRVWTGQTLIGIELVDVDFADEAAAEGGGDSAAGDEDYEEVVGDVPPDFRLTLDPGGEVGALDFEAVILAIGDNAPDEIAGIGSCLASPYFFRIGDRVDSGVASGVADERSPDARLRSGWRQIVCIYAALGGRATLDLYRPRRL